MKNRKRFYIPDVYLGFLLLPIMALIAVLAGWALPLVTAIMKFLQHN